MNRKPFLKLAIIGFVILTLISGCAKKESVSYYDQEAKEDRTLDRGKRSVNTGKVEALPEPVQISAGSAYHSYPAWSPDGKRIAYSAYKEDKQDIWVVEIDEKGYPENKPVNITDSDSIDECPSWSPDGERIVFPSGKERGKQKLFIIDIDGNNRELLYQHQTSSGLGNISHPAWSPDGKFIAFTAEKNIWIISEDGQNRPVRITSSGYNDYPAWSPDSTQLIFYSDSALKIIKSDGTEKAKNLTGKGGLRSDFPGWSGYPSLSPDGEKIVFVSNKEKSANKEKSGTYDLWIIKSDGTGEAAYLTNDTSREFFPAWSPQGDKIAFQSDRENGFHIWIISLPSDENTDSTVDNQKK